MALQYRYEFRPVNLFVTHQTKNQAKVAVSIRKKKKREIGWFSHQFKLKKNKRSHSLTCIEFFAPNWRHFTSTGVPSIYSVISQSAYKLNCAVRAFLSFVFHSLLSRSFSYVRIFSCIIHQCLCCLFTQKMIVPRSSCGVSLCSDRTKIGIYNNL